MNRPDIDNSETDTDTGIIYSGSIKSTGIMLSTMWDQDGTIDLGGNTTIEYNEYCPIDPTDGQKSVTGCTNTAAAQIIYYAIEKYGLDLQLKLTVSDEYTSSHNGLTIDVKSDGSTPGTISFDAINSKLADYDINSADDAAALLYACGVAQEAGYSSDGTATAWNTDLFYRSGFVSAIDAWTWDGYKTHYYWFDIDDEGNYSVTDGGWEVLIENLTAGLVVGTSYPGHALVIDGYDAENDLFHINYGWGNHSDTRWYSREEMTEKGYYDFVYDLRTEKQEVFRVNDGDLYGTGTLLRAIEQANATIGSNTIIFEKSAAGKELTLPQMITLKDELRIDNFNMTLNVSDNYGLYASGDPKISLTGFSGKLFSEYYAIAFNCRSQIETDNAIICAGEFSDTEKESLWQSLENSRQNGTAPADWILENKKYAFFNSSSESSVLTFDQNSLIAGNIRTGSSDDIITISNNSTLCGSLSTGSGNNTINIDSSSRLITSTLYNKNTFNLNLLKTATDGAMITVDGSVYNLGYYGTFTIDVSRSKAGVYELVHAANSSYQASDMSDTEFSISNSIGGINTVIGKISAAGSDLVVNGITYSLDIADDRLQLTISGGSSEITADDLDGNGLADVVLHHTKQGFTGAWLTTGKDDVIKWSSLSDVKSGTEILGTGKLYGSADDGQDIFYSDGKSVGAWNVANGSVTGYKNIMSVNSTTNVLGLGDFNGDGATDLLLRSTSGDLGFFGTDGSGWNYLKGLGKEWSIAAIGDLNGDGLDDTVLRHDAGFAGTFLTQADGTVKWANLDTLADDMTIVGTGDFNGDGVDDVLLQNKSNGWVGAWLVEDGSVDSFIGLCNNKNSIEQIADFNGDGIDDLRIRAGADIGVLYVNGADDTTWQYLKSVGSEWDTKFSALA